MDYNFKVKEAVWIGTAVMSYAMYIKSIKAGKEISKSMFWFEQNEIREYCQRLIKNTVQPARVSQWFNGDHEKSSNNYLRANGSLRRLTATGEFSGVKERPEDLDVNLRLDLSYSDEYINITLFDLLSWVNEIYSPCVFEDKTEILLAPAKNRVTVHRKNIVQRQNNVVLSPKYDIDELIAKIRSFYSKIINNENARYKSWEHCYAYFQKNRKAEEFLDIMSLHLAFYLASWGMYRGSSFLLQKDYKIHIPVIKILIEEKYDSLCAVTAERLLQPETQNLVLELKERVTEAYGQRITDTLITKILLGTLGCTPAYDRYFNYGIRKYNLAPAILNKDSLKGIAGFYLNNFDKLEQARSEINSRGIIYPQMKIADMCFWQTGFDDDTEKERGENNEYWLD